MYQLKYDFACSTADLLDGASAISRFLGERVGNSTSGLNLGNQATCGLVVIFELQQSLIKAAMDDKPCNHELTAVGGQS